MSSIPNSAIPHVYDASEEKPPSGAPPIVYQALAFALAPTLIGVGLAAVAVSLVLDKLNPKPPETPSTDQVPV